MKILYVLDLYPVLSETFIRDEIKEMKQQGHEVIVTCFKLDNNIKNIPDELKPDIILNDYHYSIKEAILQLQKNLLKLNFSFSQNTIPKKEIIYHSLKIAKIALEYNVDNIHAHYGLNASSFVIQAAKFANKKSSFTVHGFDINKVNQDMSAKLKNVDKVISVSDFLKDEIIRKNNLKEQYSKKIKVIPFGVKYALKANTQERNNEYLFVGRFNKVKGIEQLIRIWSKNKNLPYLNLVGFGTEEEELKIKNKIENENLKIKILGRKNSKEIFDLMAKSKAAIFPFQINKKTGERDTGAIVVKEAMLNELPIITTDLIPNVITGIEGYIAKTGKTSSFYRKLLEFEKAPKREVMEKVFNSNKKLKEEYLIENQVRNFVKCIQ